MNYSDNRQYDYSIRKHQIDTLHVFNDNVVEIIAGVHYRVDFSAGNNHLSMHIVLSPNFPAVTPSIKIVPAPVNHKWTDSDGNVLRAPGLINFRSPMSDLGQVVHAIKREYQRFPPVIKTSELISLEFKNVSSHGQPIISPSQPEPIHSEKFPELSSLTQEELEKLNSSDSNLKKYFNSTIKDVRLVKKIASESSLRSEIDNLEASNDQLYDQIEKVRSKIKSKLELHSESISKCKDLVDKIELLNEKVKNPNELCRELEASSIDAETRSEVIVNTFLDNENSDPLHFIKNYIEARKTFHSKKCAADKLFLN